jgi:glycosyltransferase involved in cell wall biosynthesis
MRIAFLCQFFPPELGAPSARVSELARAWTNAGHDVTVVTGMPNHPTGILPPEYRGVSFAEETFHGVRVLRNWVYATPNEGFVKRTLNHLSFMLSSLWYSTWRLRGTDAIVVSSPTFFVVISAWLMSRVLGVPYVFEVRDLWPGIFVELGILKNRLIIAVLEGLEMFLYRRAARVVVVTDSFKDILVRRGLKPEHVEVVTNGVDPEYYQPQPRETAQRTAHGLDGKCVVLYIGAHGISHALQAILHSAERLRDRDDIRFVFVGEGAEKKALVQKAAALELSNVLFLPGQPKDTMPSWYATADIALVPLRDIALFETFIPSKMFEILACARPIVGSVRGEPRRILEASGGAVVVDPEDAQAIADAVRALADDPARRATLGAAGRAFVMAHYDRRVLADRYAAILAAVRAERRR